MSQAHLKFSVAAVAFAAAAGLAGVSHAQTGKVLRLGISTPPVAGMDPASMTVGPTMAVLSAAYDPLIFQAPDGTYQAGLASEWGYVGEGNAVFRFKLREGLKFSDGSELNADVVKTWLEYVQKGKGNNASKLRLVESIASDGKLEVTIKLSTPNPAMPWTLSQSGGVGLVANPKVFATENALASASAGAGQYVLDPQRSVAQSRYVFRRNPNYWNPQAVKFDEVDIRVIENPSALLSAQQTGQIDVGVGDSATADAAKKAGVKVVVGDGAYVTSIALNDRDAKFSKPLSDARVRQALNYAVDRKNLTKAMSGDYASPTAQMETKAVGEGYDDAIEAMFPYDAKKAQQLLTEAGYPKGFKFEVGCGFDGQTSCRVLEAVAANWSEIGVEAVVKAAPTRAAAAEQIGTLPAVMRKSGDVPTFSNMRNMITPKSGLSNPYDSQDAQMTEAFEAASRAKDPAPGYKKVNQRLANQGWFVPVMAASYIYFVSDKVSGVQIPRDNPIWSPFAPIEKYNWALK